MRHHDDSTDGGYAHDQEPLLAFRVIRIRKRGRERIIEHGRRLAEIDAVLFEVLPLSSRYLEWERHDYQEAIGPYAELGRSGSSDWKLPDAVPRVLDEDQRP